MKRINQVKSAAVSKLEMTLKGRVSNQTAVEEAEEAEDSNYKVVGSHPDFSEVEVREGTFKIDVKVEEEDDNGKTIKRSVYKSKNDPFRYYFAPSLPTVLNLLGAKLSEDQEQFLKEALKGDTAGPACKTLVDIWNTDERASKKASAYSSKYNEKKPITEEQVENAHASMLRNYLRANPGTSDESALQMFHQVNLIPKDFTIEDYRDNRGKR